MNEIILINISGDDQPGITNRISEILTRYNVNILDIGQSVIHKTLSLGMLIEVPQVAGSSSVLKDVLFALHDMGMQVRFEPVTEESYSTWVSQQGKQRYIITLLALKITADNLQHVTAVIKSNGLNIDKIARISGRVDLNEEPETSRAVVEFSVRGTPKDIGTMRGDFLKISNDQDIDIAFQEDDIYRRNRRLVVFDMDSTLIETEVIDELARRAGVGELVSAITEEAMQGKLDFQESFNKRLSLLKGLDESVLEDIAAKLPITEGAEKLMENLKALGYKTAILSGGFTYFAHYLQKKLGIDYVHANELDIVDGQVTGEVKGVVVDGERKAELLKQIAAEEGISLKQVIAVGDGANDLPMLSVAGLGIAFRAKPLVEKSAEHSISTLGLDAILYLLGMRDRDAI